MLKNRLKHLFDIFGLRVIDNRRRWGVDAVDDLRRMTGNLQTFKQIFDVGANEGQSALHFARRFPAARIQSYEPVSSTILEFKRRTNKEVRINAHQMALGAKVGEMEIAMFGESGKSSLLGAMGDSFHCDVSRTENVKVSTVDLELDRLDCPTLDLLKIDTEGFDLNVLMGAASALESAKIKFILFEFHHLDGKPNSSRLGSLTECSSYLTGFGYRFITVYTDAVHSNEPIGTYNALFMAPRLDLTWLP